MAGLLVICLFLLLVFPIAVPLLVAATVVTPRAAGGATNRALTAHQPLTVTQREVAATYRKYKVKEIPSFREFCFPAKYNVQKQQAFLGDYLGPQGASKEMLVFHGIGSGKTCVALQVCAGYTGKKSKPLILLPASLIPGVYAEMRSPCGNMVTPEERTQLAKTPHDQKLLSMIRSRIDDNYQIISYNKFRSTWQHIDAPVIIIDEVQNINNPTGEFYKSIHKWIKAHPRATVVLMSGTPLFDNSTELISLGKLLRLQVPDELTPTDVARIFAGKVSFFAGAPSCTFPEVTLRVKKVAMSRFQARWYAANVVAEETKRGTHKLVPSNDDFYGKTRQVANIAYPGGLMGDSGLAKLTKEMIRNHLATYSCKYAHLVKKLSRGVLCFIYSAFAGAGGVKGLCKVLRAYNWKDFSTAGPGQKRYALWTGEQSQQEKDKIRATFNDPSNDNGGRIQTIIGSPAIKEGVSLARVRRIFVMEFYWNHSRMAQIFGRGTRFCSHKSLPSADRTVDITVYASVNPYADKKIATRYSIDLYMKSIADAKRAQNEPYVRALQDCAVDRELFAVANDHAWSMPT